MPNHLTIIFSISLLASTACVKTSTETNSSNNNFSATNSSSIISSGEPANSKASNNNSKTKSYANNPNAKLFLGDIGGKRVRINLTRDGNNLSGTYQYEKIGKDLKLTGTIDAAGNFTLQESDEAGNKTGKWKGSWNEDDDSITLTGKWISPKGAPELEFSANMQVIEFTGGAKFLTKSSRENNKVKHYEISAEYPELTGVNPAAANFNQMVKKIAADAGAQFKESIADMTPEDLKRFVGDNSGLYDELSYNIELANDDVISLFFTDANYTGGAHPNSSSQTLNFDLKNNRELKLVDIFELNSNYLKTISDYSLADLKKQFQEGDMADDQMMNDGAGPKEDNFKSWNLTKKGLTINFDPYQVAAYAAGPQTVVIPYSKLQNILRKDGVAARLAK